MASSRPLACLRCERTGMYKARGLCPYCYKTCTLNGSLSEYPRRTRAFAEVWEEYEFFRDYVCPGATVATAARHLGMTYAALQRALERHRARQRAERTTVA